MSPPLSKSPKLAAEIPIDPDPDPPPSKSTTPGFLWSSLFADSTSAKTPSSSPSYLPDGTPVVVAPPSVILRASSSWAGHLLCRFLGEPPSPAKFFNDLNRVWGKFGDISVRRFSSGIFLVHVPSPSTRRWILQTGLWSSGTVSFMVSEWSVNSNLAPPPKLTSAATVITIRDIPPQLWSHEAVATIAGGVATLIPGTRASLPLSSLGTATIRAIVPLGSSLPPSVLVKDSNGDSVLVSIDYGRLPHLCSLCNSYGHQSHRCLLRQSASKPIPPKSNTKQGKNSDPETLPVVNQNPLSQAGNMLPQKVTDSPDLCLIKSPINAPESTTQTMDLDTIVGKELGMVLNCSSDYHSDSAPSLDPEVSQPNVGEANQKTHSTSTEDPEAIEQIMDVDSKVDEGMVLKVLDPDMVDVCPSPIKTEFIGPLASPALVQPASLDPTPQPQSQACSDLLNNSPLDKNLVKAIASPSSPGDRMLTGSSVDILGQSLTHSEGSTDPSPYSNIPAKFDLSPSLNSDQEPSINSPSVVHSSKGHSMGKREGTRDSRKLKALHSSLRCVQVKYPYKPKGAVEKSRRKVNQACVPDDKEVHQCILEMQSDKNNSLHFEALDVHKVLREYESEGDNVVTT